MTGLNASVCIPWRPSPSRLAPFEKVMGFWQDQEPNEIITADSTTEIFSLSQARNRAVACASSPVVIICDADTIPPIASVHAAVADPVGVIWPHTTWRLIPAEYAHRPISEFPDAPTVLEYVDGLGGVMVTTTAEYWRLGGQPEEFVGWGYEDCSFHHVVTTLSKFRREPGVAYSIDHNDPNGKADSPGWSRDETRNRALFDRYYNASGRPWLMRELLRQRDAPPPDTLDDGYRKATAGRYHP